MKRIWIGGLVMILTSCSVFQKKQGLDTSKEVIIVGAGIAGLSAAKYLKQRGYHPIVLEAQSVVGGRLKTNRSTGIAFDEGASWIHGPEGNPITSLAKQANRSTFLTADESVKVYDKQGKLYDEATLDKEEAKYNRALTKLKGKKGKSFANAFYEQYPEYKSNDLWQYMLSAFLEFDTGADINRLSSKDFYDDETFEGEDIIVTNGYDGIANYLAENLNIVLNTTVTGITYTGDKVEIKTAQVSYTADKVLVTVPLGVLKKNKIHFNPVLPSRIQTVIDGLEMGTVNKFLLVWDKAFWDEKVQYIGYTAEEKGKFNYFLNLKKLGDVNALMTFAFGDYAKQTENMTDDEVVADIMQHLEKIYGKDIPHPSKFLRTKWHNDPYTFGAYTAVSPQVRSKQIKQFSKPIDAKVYFAGEHTHSDYRGTVHGAYLSGIRAAKRILEQ